jgi:hypothetical protein
MEIFDFLISDGSPAIPRFGLAHRTSDKKEAAYRRGDQFEKRLKLMEVWPSRCSPHPSIKIRKLRKSIL